MQGWKCFTCMHACVDFSIVCVCVCVGVCCVSCVHNGHVQINDADSFIPLPLLCNLQLQCNGQSFGIGS